MRITPLMGVNLAVLLAEVFVDILIVVVLQVVLIVRQVLQGVAATFVTVADALGVEVFRNMGCQRVFEFVLVAATPVHEVSVAQNGTTARALETRLHHPLHG